MFSAQFQTWDTKTEHILFSHLLNWLCSYMTVCSFGAKKEHGLKMAG